MKSDNKYTKMQKAQYAKGASNHLEHNDNPDYWDILLEPLKYDKWDNKKAPDFGCGKGRNIENLLKLAEWAYVDGVDISSGNIKYCKKTFSDSKSKFYENNGVDLKAFPSNIYDFVLSTITLQHIPVYDIRDVLLKEIFRVMAPGGLFSFQMGWGEKIDKEQADYKDNFYNARGTNSIVDVNIDNVNDLIEHLEVIGFKHIRFTIRKSFSDIKHDEWIYTRAIK